MFNPLQHLSGKNYLEHKRRRSTPSARHLLLFTRRTATISDFFCCYLALGVTEKRGFPWRWLAPDCFFAAHNSDISDHGSMSNICGKVSLAVSGVPTGGSERRRCAGGNSPCARHLVAAVLLSLGRWQPGEVARWPGNAG